MANAWSAFYWGDYLSDTSHLSLAQHGAYILLMGHYYRTRRPLPRDLSILHRICRSKTAREKSAIDFVLREFFTSDGDVYRHHRIDQELAKTTDISGKRRELGRRGGLAKAKNLLGHLLEPKPSLPQPQPHKTKAKAKPCARSAHTGAIPFPREKTEEKAADPRYKPFLDVLDCYWQAHNTIPFVFDASEGKALKLLLESSPHFSVEQFEACLHNRGHSEGVAHGERPRIWLSEVTRYSAGPLDRFGKVKGNGNEQQRQRQFTPTNNLMRAAFNNAAANEVFPERAGMGRAGAGDGPGQAPRITAGNPPLLEGKAKTVQ